MEREPPDFDGTWQGESILLAGCKVYNQARRWARGKPVRAMVEATINMWTWKFINPECTDAL